MKTFLDRLYWALGIFLLLWSAVAITGIYRRTILEFPIIGKTQITETIIFAQIIFSVLLPCLLYVVATYRAAAALRRWPSRFPGVPEGEFEIPVSFSWLRAGVFFTLAIIPTIAFVLCFCRMFGGVRIQWNNDHQPVRLERWELFTFPPRPEPQSEYANWRWRGNDAPGDVPESKMSAAPGFEPLWFAFSGTGCAVVSLRDRPRQDHLRRDAAEVPDRAAIREHFPQDDLLHPRLATLRQAKGAAPGRQLAHPFGQRVCLGLTGKQLLTHIGGMFVTPDRKPDVFTAIRN